MSEVDTFVEFAHELSDIGRSIARQSYGNAPHFVSKSDGTPVTETDQAIEKALVDRIVDRFPTHGILGEEYGSREVENEYVWVVDPIDGTKAFAVGLPTFGTLISLCRAGSPIIGIIEMPIAQQRCIGVEGRATEFNNSPVRCRPCRHLSESIMSANGPEFYRGVTPREGYERLWPKTRWNIFGGSCLVYASLARGLIDLCLEGSNLSPFDFCALVPVVNGAGGNISDWQGNALDLKNGVDIKAAGVLASGDPAIHRQALEVLNA